MPGEHVLYKTGGYNFWSITLLDYHFVNRLYQKQQALPKNFSQNLSTTITTIVLEAFKDEYLFDFISLEESEDQRVPEASISQH